MVDRAHEQRDRVVLLGGGRGGFLGHDGLPGGRRIFGRYRHRYHRHAIRQGPRPARNRLAGRRLHLSRGKDNLWPQSGRRYRCDYSATPRRASTVSRTSRAASRRAAPAAPATPEPAANALSAHWSTTASAPGASRSSASRSRTPVSTASASAFPPPAPPAPTVASGSASPAPTVASGSASPAPWSSAGETAARQRTRRRRA